VELSELDGEHELAYIVVAEQVVCVELIELVCEHEPVYTVVAEQVLCTELDDKVEEDNVEEQELA